MMLSKKLLTFSAVTSMFIASSIASADPWQFEVAPYLWAINMNGRVQSGPITAHVSENFEDIMKQFHGGGMLYIDARKDKFGLFFNGVYAVLAKDTDDGPFTIHSKNNFGIFSVGGSYEVYKKVCGCSQVMVEPYLGLRYTLNNTTLKLEDTALSVSNNQNWTDPIIGLRVRYNINQYWLAVIAGDVGGTNMNDHNSYNINAIIGYRPESLKNTRFYLGYRLLYQHYATGSGLKYFSWDMKLFGPALGFSVTF